MSFERDYTILPSQKQDIQFCTQPNTQHFFFIDKVKLALKLAHRKARDGIYSANHEEEIIL